MARKTHFPHGLRAAVRLAPLALGLLLSAPAAHGQCTTQEVQELLGSATTAGDALGWSVAVAGDLAVAGAHGEDGTGQDSGAAYLFERDFGGVGTWSQKARLEGTDTAALDFFGWALALSGGTLAVGAYGDDDFGERTGAVYLFEKSGGSWAQVTKVLADDASGASEFGYAVALSGDRLVVGARLEDSAAADAGAVYVFERDEGGPDTWGQVAKLTGSVAVAGDQLGYSVAIDGATALAGAVGDDGHGVNSGAAYVFDGDAGGPGVWGEVLRVDAADGAHSDGFGTSVAVSGDTALVGSPFDDDGGSASGSVYVLGRDQGGPDAWGEQAKLTAAVATAGDQFGWSLALEADTALIGARLDDDVAGNAGAAYLLDRDQGGAGAWGETGKITASDAGAGDALGSSVAVAGGLALVGAPGHDHLAAAQTGAAYLFAGAAGPAPVNYCTAGTSASGCQALLSTSGVPSATATSGFVLSALSMEGDKSGLFFFNSNGRQANPWGSGTSRQCVVPPVFRGGLQVGTGSPGACDGTLSQDLNALWCPSCPKPLKNLGGGATVQAQLWYRDPQNTSNQTTSLSDAIEFVMCP